MSSVFSIALSSLQAESEAINTTGHNLANLNTTGFKESNVNFRDLVAASLSGDSTGLGVSRPINQHTLTINLTQKTTANTWDYTVTIPSSDLAAGTGTTTTLNSGTLKFNTDGTLASNTATLPAAAPADTTLAPIGITVAGLKDSA